MIKLEKQEAKVIVGGAAYTWIQGARYSSGMCNYTRYKHVMDKYGNDTGKMNYDGLELLDCKRGHSFTGNSLSDY